MLWGLLRGRCVDGLRFRRQMPIGDHVVDFCCLSIRLVVEVDGGIHDQRVVEDAERDLELAAKGFRVLRFSNETVMARPNVVLEGIRGGG